jgi:large conductance mechanosensitive channel
LVRRFIDEFKEFIARGNVLDLAVGIVIGVAFQAVIQSFTNDVLMAVIGTVVGEPNFNDLTLEIGDGVVAYGRLLTAVANFLLIAFALFLVVKAFNRFRRKEEPEPQSTEKDVLIEIRDLLAQEIGTLPPVSQTPRNPSSQESRTAPPTAPQPAPPSGPRRPPTPPRQPPRR